MKLYEHVTDGGAEYYSTTFIETHTGHKEGTFNGVILRTDGDTLEIMNFDKLKNAGFKSVILPNGTSISLEENNKQPKNNHEIWHTCEHCYKEYDLRKHWKCPTCGVLPKRNY